VLVAVHLGHGDERLDEALAVDGVALVCACTAYFDGRAGCAASLQHIGVFEEHCAPHVGRVADEAQVVADVLRRRVQVHVHRARGAVGPL